MLAALLNGRHVAPDQAAIHLDDRGLLYGDGLFESMLLCNGTIRFLEDHLQRMSRGLARLKMRIPDDALLRDELVRLTQGIDNGVVKLIVTGGRALRGYRRTADPECTRLLQLFAPLTTDNQGIVVRWCETRYARTSLLAGIKHLNRLEQVLAQSEWQDTEIAEGLVLDTEGELISGTMSNLFMVIDNVLTTPDLRYCGVSGVMRGKVLQFAHDMRVDIEVRAVRPEELHSASEVFMTNAVRGIRPVISLSNDSGESMRWTVGAVTAGLKQKLHEVSFSK